MNSMSDHEHVDVTTTEDLNESPPLEKCPSTKCGYCDCAKEGLPVFHCESCGRWVHTSCLRSGSPSPILFDNFYHFKCISCSEDGKESFSRMRVTWNQATCLALFNISQASPGNQGFHKWKDTVGGFIDKHWDLLFENYRKKTNTWINTIAAVMSAGNPRQFTSGYGFIKESGWWKLTDPTKPPEYTPPSKVKEPKPKKLKSYLTSTPSPSAGKLEGLRKRPYQSSAFNASQLKEKRSRTQENLEIRTIEFLKDACSSSSDEISKDLHEKQQINEVSSSASKIKVLKTPLSKSAALEECETNNASSVPEDSPPSFKGCGSPISSPLSSPRSLSVTSMLSKGDMLPDSTLPLAILSDDSDDEGRYSVKRGRARSPDKYFTPLSATCSAFSTPRATPPPNGMDIMSAMNGERIPSSAFSAVRKKKSIKVATTGDEAADRSTSPKMLEMSLYEERALLKKLDSYGPLLKEVPEACRLRRKLLVRQKKRELNVPIVSFDETVRRLQAREKGAILPDAYNISESYHPLHILPALATSKHHRILDRFQSSRPLPAGEMKSQMTFRQKLVGCEDDETPSAVISPYTQRVLKPYIRRDYESKPIKLAVMEEIISHSKSLCSPSKSSIASIDYCYVRPHHIPTINAMCHHFFWPGIDLSETLQYPDFSIVALYKKMVIGFGFMVPDVNFNEAYISFLLVHPDWQRAGIGTFIIYHLIQTCMGKEVTLHVSASNSAMLLYQKFGFKPEQFISDFYDKYHAVDSTECKHAFFMRLRR